MIIKELRNSKEETYLILEEASLTNTDTGKVFTCPRGFVTDYASTNILKFDEVGQPAALIHDVDYWFQTKARAQADKDFKDNLIFLGVSKVKAYAYYAVLRLVGGHAWRKNKNQRDLQFDKNKVLSEEEIKKALSGDKKA